MKNKKQLIFVAIVAVLLSLFSISALKLLGGKNNLGTGQKETSNVTAAYNISSSFAAAKKEPGKITLLDSYDTVIAVLGKPNTIAETQTMFDLFGPGTPDPFKGDIYMQYDNFLVMLREDEVAGWYFDPQKASDKEALFYLPELKVATTGSFSSIYQAWDNLDSLMKPDILKVFTALNGNFIGKLQYCITWGWDANSKGITFAEVSFFNEQYKITQQYNFGGGVLLTKLIRAEDLSLIKGGEKDNSVFLGEKMAYIKTLLGTGAILKDPKSYATPALKNTTIAAFKKGNLNYYFTFNKNGECIGVEVEA